MKRRRESWYGPSIVHKLPGIILPAIPFGLGIGYATGRYLASFITSLSISSTTYALIEFDLAYIHPRLEKLPVEWQARMEYISGLIEHILGAWLAFAVCNRIFGFFLKGTMAWYMAGGTIAASMVVHTFSYTMYSHLELKKKIVQEEQLRAMATRAELKALKAQINPHFLFNTLNTIAALIHSDPAKAEATVEQLAKMFRYVLNVSERRMVPLEEELAFLNDYLEIERARFGEQLCVTRKVDSKALSVLIPSLILQPLAENAIKHGRGRAGDIDLVVDARLVDDKVVIVIADQGPGMPPNYKVGAGPGHGLRNVDERLRKIFGAGCGLKVAGNEPQGTVVTVEIPAGGGT